MENPTKTSSVNSRADYQQMLDEVNKLRQERFIAISLLLIILLITMVYGTLKNPFIHTFSKIGNYFSYRTWYIAWAVTVSFCMHTTTILLFRLGKYTSKLGYGGIACASFFLIITAIIPSLKEQLPLWHVIHKWTTFFYVMSMITSLYPFFIYLSRKIPRLKVLLRNWQLLILIGSLTSLIIQGQTGIFELWFYFSLVTLMLYLSWTLFTEAINKASTYSGNNNREIS